MYELGNRIYYYTWTHGRDRLITLELDRIKKRILALIDCLKYINYTAMHLSCLQWTSSLIKWFLFCYSSIYPET